MRRFLASAWFPFVIALLCAGVSATSFALLKPETPLGNSTLQQAVDIGGWVVGPAMALLSFILIGILNLLRRMLRIRKVALLHPLVIVAGFLPWLVMSWQITDEPRHIELASAVIDFIARPMLWGALTAVVATLLLSIPLLIPAKKT